MDAAWFGAVGTWVGAIGQVIVAIAAGVIAYQTFLYFRRQARFASVHSQMTLVNEFNRMIIESQTARDYLVKCRASVIGPVEDSILFMYLNYMNTTFHARSERMVSEAVCNEALTNGAHFFAKLSNDQLQRLLSRGYSDEFSKAVMAKFKDVSKN